MTFFYFIFYFIIVFVLLILVRFDISLVLTGHGSDTSKTTEEALKLIRRSLKSKDMGRVEGTCFDESYPHVFVTFGASVSLLFAQIFSIP